MGQFPSGRHVSFRVACKPIQGFTTVANHQLDLGSGFSRWTTNCGEGIPSGIIWDIMEYYWDIME